MFDNVIVLAGGAGNRLWPFSSDARPKYLLKIARGRSLLRDTLMRANAVARSKIVIVSHHSHASHIIDEARACAGIDKEVVTLLEPRARNTAPAIALACAYLRECGGGSGDGAGGSALCMPADHLIYPLPLFVEDARRAAELAGRGYVTLFGIAPQEVNTGYGHIEVGGKIEIGGDLGAGGDVEAVGARGDLGAGYAIKKFHEKPDRATAESYMKSGRFFWNGGLYGFSVSVLWDELAAHEPAITERLGARGLFDVVRDGGIWVQRDSEALRGAYRQMPTIAIDYAVAERSARVAMVPARFRWNDIGSWDEICRLIEEGDIDNPERGVVLTRDAENNTIISDNTVALCGVHDIIVVVKDGVTLICKKGSSQDVKELAVEYARRQREGRREAEMEAGAGTGAE